MPHTIFTGRNIILGTAILVLGAGSFYGYREFYRSDISTISEEVSVPLPPPETPPSLHEGEQSMTEPTKPDLISQKIEEEKADDERVPAANKAERAEILIKKADYLSTSNEYTEAMQLYERAIRLKSSEDIEKKLAHIAFRAKKFQKSADYYKKNLDSLSTSGKIEFLHALRYTGDDEFSVALANMRLPEYVQQAFEVSWTCENEFISCEKAIRAYKYDYAPIRDLKNALKNYENLGNHDADYKEALLVGAWYKNGDYTTAIKVGENLLRRKPDYRPVLKIVGFSSYMIGYYDRSQAALSKYKKLEPKDPEVDFVLGLIHFEKGDYETSNIYFNNAVLGGYKPKIVVERKLAFNYYALGLKKNMFQVLGYLVMNSDVTISDINNAVFLALTYNETRSAGEWIKQGITKFPESSDLLVLQAWHLRITNKVADAKKILTKVLTKNPNHLLALIESGINAYNDGDTVKAKEHFKKAQIINAGGSWSKTIEAYLAKL